MSRAKPVYLTCISVSTLSLSFGLSWAGRWIWGLAAFLPALLLFLSAHRKTGLASGQAQTMLAPAYLILSVGLAAAGLILQAPPLLMLTGAVASLAAWDLFFLESGITPDYTPESGFFESRHLMALTLSVGLGLFLAIAGRSLRLQLSFATSLVLVTLIAFSVNQIIKRLTSVYN
jgi:hypothetical protein